MTGVTDGVDGVTDGVTGVTDGVTDRFAEETLTILLVVLLSLSNAYFVPPPSFFEGRADTGMGIEDAV